MADHELLTRVVTRCGGVVSSVRDDQWPRPTPCSEWDVRALVHHLVGELRWMPPLLAGRTIAEVGDALDGDLLGDDPRAAWEAAVREATGAAADPAALERTVHLSYADVPGADYVFEVSADLTIHTWDLARAVGADERLDPGLIELFAPWYAERIEMMRQAGIFAGGLEAPPEADRQTRLLALLGRRSW
jgi:uncharacterized protein (TIGR03086 family)